MMKHTKRLLAGIAVGTVALFATSTTLAQAQPPAEKPKQDDKQPKQAEKPKGENKPEAADKGKAGGAAVGQPAPDFALTDTAGKQYRLADLLKDGKTIVVLEWFNPGCPFVVKHHETFSTMTDTAAKYKDKGVVWLAINSGGAGKEGAGKERNDKAKADWKMEYPVLLDESGTVGRSYGAKTTPHMFVIGKDGTLAYMGAIDDERSPEKQGQTNYVAKALDELLAGTNVTKPETAPYGCSVKYGSSKN